MRSVKELKDRKHSLFTSSISGEVDGEVYVLGKKLTELAKEKSFSYIVSSMFLGRLISSKKLEQFVDLVLRLLVDHGPYVSGAVNTMITARAGKDLPSALSAGLLTIGQRFGGAINAAAKVWLEGVKTNKQAADLVEELAKRKEYIPGIGHKKYRIDMPDPRVLMLKQMGSKVNPHRHLDFALKVERVTALKKPNLILNVDGLIAAVLLDMLIVEEKLSYQELDKLIVSEFFNALFILSRSVGFIAHYLDQKRLGEGLFRLSSQEIYSRI